MSCGIGALQFNESNIANQAIWACSRHGQSRMVNEADFGNVPIEIKTVCLADFGLSIETPLHRRIRVLLSLLFSKAFGDKLRHIISTRCSPTSLSLGNYVGNTRGCNFA